MDGMTGVDARGANAKGVVAPINFIEPMKEKPYSYNYEPPPGVSPRNTREETHTVTIFDARPLNDRLSLDREGFILVLHPTEAADLYELRLLLGVVRDDRLAEQVQRGLRLGRDRVTDEHHIRWRQFARRRGRPRGGALTGCGFDVPGGRGSVRSSAP